MYRHSAISVTLFTALQCFTSAPSSAIGAREFFERLQESWNGIQTFQADVIQESRYSSDGLVQMYQGRIFLGEDGRIAYDYDLTTEWNDPSLIRSGAKGKEPASPPPKVDHPDSGQGKKGGAYRAAADVVIHYDPERDLLVESPEDETVLIQVFRGMLGSGDFNADRFREENKISDISEIAMEDGTAIYKLVAIPKKGSPAYNWAKQSGNKELNLRQELWVEAATMRPIKAVLLSEDESTSVTLRNAKVNQPVDDNVFLLTPKDGKLPTKVRRGSLNAPAPKPSQQEFQGVPLEEIPVEGN